MPDLIAGPGSVLFHGTAAALIPEIMERGLEPRQPAGLLAALEPAGIYLTPYLDLAEVAGEAQSRGAPHAVLVVDASDLRLLEQRLWMPLGRAFGWTDEHGVATTYVAPATIEAGRLSLWGEPPHGRLDRGLSFRQPSTETSS
jgi:hypothetical protein